MILLSNRVSSSRGKIRKIEFDTQGEKEEKREMEREREKVCILKEGKKERGRKRCVLRNRNGPSLFF